MALLGEKKHCPDDRVVQEIVDGALDYQQLADRFGHEIAFIIMNVVTAGQLGLITKLEVEEYIRDSVRDSPAGIRE